MRSTLGWLAGGLFLFAGCGSTGDTGPTGPAGPAGANGSNGSGGDASTLAGAVSGVSPNGGLLGRELDVIVSGDATTFDTTTTLDFGKGITVSNLSVVSRAAIRAHLAIDVSATVGPHDVTVGGASGGIAHGAFVVAPSLIVTTFSSTISAGGVYSVQLSPPPGETFSEAAVVSGPVGGADGQLIVSGNSAITSVLVDPVAPSGPAQIVLGEDQLEPDGGSAPVRIYASDPSALPLTANAPTTLSLPATQTPAFPATGSVNFKVSTSGVGILSQSTTSDSLSLNSYVVPASGKASQLLGAEQITSSGPADFAFIDSDARDTYLALVNNGAAITATYNVTFTPVSLVPSSAHGNTCGAPQSITLPAIVTGTIENGAIDCYSFSFTAGAKIEATFQPVGGIRRTNITLGGSTAGTYGSDQILSITDAPGGTTSHIYVSSDTNPAGYALAIRQLP